MLLNNNVLKVFAEFSSDYNKKIYGGQVARKLKMNQKTVANVLNAFEKHHILKYATEGKNKYYFLNKLNPQISDILKILELARKNNFVTKYLKFRELFLALEKKSSGILIIFGSYASFTSNEKSDLDVFVLGKIGEIKDLEEKYGIKINIVKSNKEKFDKNDVFVKEIIKNHIILKGVEQFIDFVW